jgi:hypothetical protein
MLTQLQTLVARLFRRSDGSEEAREQSVLALWLVSVGTHIRQVTAPVKLERKTLIVAVVDETWRAQLKSIRGELLFRLNSLFGAPAVTSIEFVVNPRLIPQTGGRSDCFEFLAPEQQAEPLRKVASEISSVEIRDAFLRAAGKCLERRAR